METFNNYMFFICLVRSDRSQLQKAAQPVLTSVSVDWRHDDQHPAPIQAPQQITALFSGSRQVVYGFVDNCYMVTGFILYCNQLFIEDAIL